MGRDVVRDWEAEDDDRVGGVSPPPSPRRRAAEQAAAAAVPAAADKEAQREAKTLAHETALSCSSSRSSKVE